MILSGVKMLIENRLDFLVAQIQKGCRCTHFALVSGDFRDGDVSKAKSLGITIFKKPFKLREVINWLD